MEFWEKKNKLRRSLSFKNRTLFVIEKLVEEDEANIHDVLEKIITASPIYHDKILKLEKEYPDISGVVLPVASIS